MDSKPPPSPTPRPESSTSSGGHGIPTSASGPRGGLAWALLVVAASTGLCWFTRQWFSLAEQVMVYVIGVLVTASWLARRDALLCALASVAALDYFFVPPTFGFTPTNLRHVWTLVAFLATSAVVSSLALSVRHQAELARDRERRVAALYAVARALSGSGDGEGIARIAAAEVRSSLGLEAHVSLAGPDAELLPIGDDESAFMRSEPESTAALWVLVHGKPAGAGTHHTGGASGLHLPLATGGRVRGVLSVDLRRAPFGALPAAREFLDAVAALTAVALERAVLVEEAQRAHLTAESERARSTLLSAVSHDLRTPLASVTGALGALLAPGSNLSEDARRRLLVSSHAVSERLGKLVTNLLDLARVEAGGRIRREWYPLEELVASAIDRVRPALGGRPIDVSIPEEVLQVRVDGVLVEQVLVNLLENVAKHTPPGTPVEVRVRVGSDEVGVDVLDRGPGIPEAELERVFEGFRRLSTDRGADGTGLGLALCRAIVNAHGGRILAERRSGGGTAFRFALPREVEPAVPPEATRVSSGESS